jgi:hypothetical protein
MSKKYVLTDTTTRWLGRMLYQIKAAIDRLAGLEEQKDAPETSD